MSTLKYISIGGIWLALLSCAPARAQQPAATPQDQQQGQQPSQSQPIPAIRSPLASGADNDQDEAPNPQLMQPDTRSLTGVQDLSLGSMALEHSYWQPRLSFLRNCGLQSRILFGRKWFLGHVDLALGRS